MSTTSRCSESHSQKTLILQNPPQIWLGSPGQGLLHSESAVTRSSATESPHQHSLPGQIGLLIRVMKSDYRFPTSNKQSLYRSRLPRNDHEPDRAQHSCWDCQSQGVIFSLVMLSHLSYSVRDLFHSRWPWTRTGNVLCQESRTHCPFQSENDSDIDANSGWMILG